MKIKLEIFGIFNNFLFKANAQEIQQNPVNCENDETTAPLRFCEIQFDDNGIYQYTGSDIIEIQSNKNFIVMIRSGYFEGERMPDTIIIKNKKTGSLILKKFNQIRFHKKINLFDFMLN